MNLSSLAEAKAELIAKIQLKKELDLRLIEQRAHFDFPYFVETVFAESFDQFISGAFMGHVARFLDSNNRTARIGARDHFKSTSLYARFMFRLFETRARDFEAHYFSYQEQMSGYHIEKIKRLITPDPYFSRLSDLKTIADTVGAWCWDREHQITLIPKSLLAFKRGNHPGWMAVDDLFQDSENKLSRPPVILGMVTSRAP